MIDFFFVTTGFFGGSLVLCLWRVSVFFLYVNRIGEITCICLQLWCRTIKVRCFDVQLKIWRKQLGYWLKQYYCIIFCLLLEDSFLKNSLLPTIKIIAVDSYKTYSTSSLFVSLRVIEILAEASQYFVLILAIPWCQIVASIRALQVRVVCEANAQVRDATCQVTRRPSIQIQI